MDAEQAMNYIFHRQARTEAILAEVAESQRRAEQRMDRAEQRMDRMDKQLQGTAKLVSKGIQIVVKLGRSVNDLTTAQQRTEKKLAGLLSLLQNRSRNGR
ncbi:MAG: hypothetical protein HY235_16255 [Acidobacteria bacterium]|nr:hypothetical protein [Acidobacteriota bacterium]